MLVCYSFSSKILSSKKFAEFDTVHWMSAKTFGIQPVQLNSSTTECKITK